MKGFQFTLVVILLLSTFKEDDLLAEAANVQEFLQSFIQGGLAGYPLVHKVQEFDEFDPHISMKRRSQFYELHGYRADKFIERIGLGIDGKEQERLQEQQVRDQGRLQGNHLLLND